MSKLEQVQQEFVDKLIKSLEKGQIPWHKEWDAPTRDYNYSSGKYYQGTNELMLFFAKAYTGWKDPRWMTFQQAKDKGFRVRKGSVGTPIFFYSLIDTETKKLITQFEYRQMTDEERENVRVVTKTYTVFNGEQIDGIPKLDKAESKAVVFENEKVKEFSEVMQKNMHLTLEHHGNSAYYSPLEDKVVLPPQDYFHDEQGYYATMFHEFSHSTMHASRLNRDCKGMFVSPEYALEELRAELTSVFVTMDTGFHLDQGHEENHQAYIQSWIQELKAKPKALFDAIHDATKIHHYMLEQGEYTRIYKQEKAEVKTEENVKEQSAEQEVKVEVQQQLNETPVPSEPVLDTPAIDLTDFLGIQGLAEPVSTEKDYQERRNAAINEYNELLASGQIRVKTEENVKEQSAEQEVKVEVQQQLNETPVPSEPVLDTPAIDLTDFLGIQGLAEPVSTEKDYQERRNAAINEYNELLASGQIRVKTEIEKQMDIAHGNEDNAATYHARKMLYQKGIDWRTGKKIEQYKPPKNQPNLDVMKDSVSIIDYAMDRLGFHFIKESKGNYRIEEHDSCKIYPNNTFCRFSRDQKNNFRKVGGSIIDFIKHFESVDTGEAIDRLTEYYLEHKPEVQFDSKSKRERPAVSVRSNVPGIEVPDKAETNKHVYAYLTRKRMINPEIVQWYIRNNMLYEDENHNCVFVGKYNNTIYYANLRGTGPKAFKQDVKDSYKEIGIYVNNNSDTLVINEAVIDQMSYQSLCPHPEKFSYLSAQGAANTINVLRFHMSKRPEAKNIKRIIVALDNDLAGEENALKTIEYIKENYPEIETLYHLPKGKDFNEQLVQERELLYSTAPEQDNSPTLGEHL